MEFSKITTNQLVIILGLIILFLPAILIQNSFFDFFSFGTESEIGDIMGGITGPFINAIAAILVFIAFKEQVKANNLIKEQQYFQHIQEQIYRLEDDFLDIPEIVNIIEKNINTSFSIQRGAIGKENASVTIHLNDSALNKAIYSTVLFQQTIDLIDKLEHNKEFMEKKIKTLYKIIYKDDYLKLDKALKNILSYESSSTLYIAELLLQIKDLEKKFEN